MRYNRHLSHNDYENLFSGKVKYLINNHTKLGYGPKMPWYRVVYYKLLNYLRLSHCIANFKYQYYFQYYCIFATLKGKEMFDLCFWSDEEISQFITEKDLKPGDRLTIYYIRPYDNGIGYWSAGGTDILVTKGGFLIMNRIWGA